MYRPAPGWVGAAFPPPGISGVFSFFFFLILGCFFPSFHTGKKKEKGKNEIPMKKRNSGRETAGKRCPHPFPPTLFTVYSGIFFFFLVFFTYFGVFRDQNVRRRRRWQDGRFEINPSFGWFFFIFWAFREKMWASGRRRGRGSGEWGWGRGAGGGGVGEGSRPDPRPTPPRLLG